MENVDAAVDVISDLPDTVLQHILSYLPTIEAVRTSVLSRRWRSLWLAVPALHFNQEEFPGQEPFWELVEGVLASRDACTAVTSFHLSVSNAMDRPSVLKWLKCAMERRVEEVEFEVLLGGIHGESGIFPGFLLCCPMLRRLKLALPLWKVVFDGTICIPSLKTIHLKGIQSLEQSLGILLSSCPVLEELHLEDCNFDHLEITANELKTLTITSCIFDAYNKIEIFTPKLQRFNYASGKTQGCFIYDMFNLVDARIMLFNLTHPNSSWSVCNILMGLSSASSLTLTYLGNQLFTVRHLEPLLRFLKLKYLRLNIFFSDHYLETIAYMLKHMPALKTLEIYDKLSSPKESVRWVSKHLSEGTLNCVESIRLGNFESSDKATEIVEFLMRNGKIIEDNKLHKCLYRRRKRL